MTLEEKLDKIIELLEAIKVNTTPVVTWPIAPTVWVNDYPQDTGNSQWITVQPTAPTKVCECDHCSQTTDVAGGCVMCGCKLVSVYTEDGNWWCNKCYRNNPSIVGYP